MQTVGCLLSASFSGERYIKIREKLHFNFHGYFNLKRNFASTPPLFLLLVVAELIPTRFFLLLSIHHKGRKYISPSHSSSKHDWQKKERITIIGVKVERRKLEHDFFLLLLFSLALSEKSTAPFFFFLLLLLLSRCWKRHWMKLSNHPPRFFNHFPYPQLNVFTCTTTPAQYVHRWQR